MKSMGLVALLLVAGCAQMDMASEGRLRPLPAGGYEAMLPISAFSPDGDATAEADRLAYVGKMMTERGYCPGGWEVTHRQVVLRKEVWTGDQRDVYYTLACKPS